MTEERKKEVLDRVRQMLDADERVRIVSASSVKARRDHNVGLAVYRGTEEYLLIAVGEETDAERAAVRMLNSVVLDGR